MEVKLDLTPKKVGAWMAIGSTFLTALVGVAAWFLTADLRHELTLKNAEAVEYLTEQNEEYELLWGEHKNKRIREVLEREEELGLGNGPGRGRGQ